MQDYGMSTKWGVVRVNRQLADDCRRVYLEREGATKPKIAPRVRTYHWWMDFQKTVCGQKLLGAH